MKKENNDSSMSSTTSSASSSKDEQLLAVVANFIMAKRSKELSSWKIKKRARQLHTFKVFPFIWNQSCTGEIWELLNQCRHEQIQKLELTRNIEECHLFLCQLPTTPQELHHLKNKFLSKQFNGFFVLLPFGAKQSEWEEILFNDFKVDFTLPGPAFEKHHFELMLQMLVDLHSYDLHYTKPINFGKIQ